MRGLGHANREILTGARGYAAIAPDRLAQRSENEAVQAQVHHLRLLRYADELPDGADGPEDLCGSYPPGADGGLRRRFRGLSVRRSAGRLEAVPGCHSQLDRAHVPQVETPVPGTGGPAMLRRSADLGAAPGRAGGAFQGRQGNPAGDPVERLE